MGTKLNPGKFDCYAAALPDEPMFVLLARDPQFFNLVCTWASQRQYDINCGVRPNEDQAMVSEAYDCSFEGVRWRKNNNGIWRKDK